MLDTIPHEILSQIAYHIILTTLSPPLNLLLACRSLHDALAPTTNPNIYADVFKHHYDIAAPTRRLMTTLSSQNLVDELRVRTRVLTRLAALQRRQAAVSAATRATMIVSGQCAEDTSISVTAEDLWVAYLMLMENDGKNLPHFIGADADVDIMSIIDTHFEQSLVLGDSTIGYPPDRPVDALAMWISWLLAGDTRKLINRDNQLNSGHLRPDLNVSFRPYIFAAHHYDLFFAPWTLPDLPVHDKREETLVQSPYAIDQTPRSRHDTIVYYGRTLEIATPLLTHAAILRFFVETREEAGSGSSPVPHFGKEADDISPPDIDVGDFPNPSLDSRVHDRDFERLLQCYDGRKTSGMSLRSWRGAFAGCWEGTFSFFDFDAFRDMLGGQISALYRGSYGEQAQVWKLRETLVRPRRGTFSSSARGLPHLGPMTNAGFPLDMPSSSEALDPIAEEATIEDTIKRQLGALEGYEVVPDSEAESELARAEAGNTGLGLLVTGVGHSAWGRFIIRGRVRIWDGLLYLVKEYAPDQRGKWVYRGYVLSDNVMVGRWRDTVTPEVYVGYEGTFVLNRR